MVTKESVLDVLKECYDPEIPVNIVDLGLIYGIDISQDKVKVRMTMTAPGCPLHSMISGDVKKRLLSLEGVKDAQVELVWEPRWTAERISPEGKKVLGLAR